MKPKVSTAQMDGRGVERGRRSGDGQATGPEGRRLQSTVAKPDSSSKHLSCNTKNAPGKTCVAYYMLAIITCWRAFAGVSPSSVTADCAHPRASCVQRGRRPALGGGTNQEERRCAGGGSDDGVRSMDHVHVSQRPGNLFRTLFHV